MSKALLPICLAAVICDRAIREEGSGKWSLIGIFSNIKTQILPAVHNNLFIYIAVTNLHVNTPLSLKITSANSPEVFEIKGEILAESPLVVAELVFHIPQMPIVSMGVHYLDVVANGEKIGGVRYTVTKLQEAS